MPQPGGRCPPAEKWWRSQFKLLADVVSSRLNRSSMRSAFRSPLHWQGWELPNGWVVWAKRLKVQARQRFASTHPADTLPLLPMRGSLSAAAELMAHASKPSTAQSPLFPERHFPLTHLFPSRLNVIIQQCLPQFSVYPWVIPLVSHLKRWLWCL